MQEDLGPPRLRRVAIRYTEWEYAVTSVDYLPLPDVPGSPEFFRVLEGRRSFRCFGPLSRGDLSALLWFTGKTLESAPPGSPRWEHRHVPSAGGRHPIDLLVLDRTLGPDTLQWYDPCAHALCTLQVRDRGALHRLRNSADHVLQGQDGVVIWHAAQFARTTSRYADGESLVWRDAGALVAVTTLVAEALGIVCCPLGTTGEPHLSGALGAERIVQGVGGCVVGSRV
jgi:SagB-type dehydrogenase family enzyme